jgi:antitoxin HigA-1
VNDQFRICFVWTPDGPEAVEFTDYHEATLMTKKLEPMHPGEVLREEFLVPLGMSPGALARACGVPRTRIERLASEDAGVTADTALRLAKAFGTSPDLWLSLQNDFDVQVAKRLIGKASQDHPDGSRSPRCMALDEVNKAVAIARRRLKRFGFEHFPMSGRDVVQRHQGRAALPGPI